MTIYERHFKPDQLGKLWGLDGNTIRRLFAREPDILTIEHPETRSKRGYRSMRIPASVANRVYQRYLSKLSRL